MKPLDPSFMREKYREAATVNLGDYAANAHEAVFNQAVSQIPDTAEGERVRDEQWANSIWEDLPQIERFIPLGNREKIDAVFSKMYSRIAEQVRIYNVAASDNPGRPGAGRLHERGPHEIIKSLVGAGKFLTERGFNARCVEAIEARMQELAPGTDIVAANFDGSIEFSDGSTMTLVEMFDAARPVSISRESWIEGFPTAEDFELVRQRFEQRQAAEQRNATPWLDNGRTDRAGHFHSFREQQS